MVKEQNDNNLYDKVLKAVQMVGIPSVIVGALFWFLGYEIWPFFKVQLTESLNMQKSVTEAIKVQAESERAVADHLVTTRDNVKANSELIKQDQEYTKKVIEMIADAKELMKGTPEQRQQMITLLETLITEQKKTSAAVEALNR